MITISANHISKSYGVEPILEDVTFSLNENEKVGVVGINGAGKSTLFKILNGELSKDGGELYFGRDISLGYLEQNIKIQSDNTLKEEVLSIFADVMELEKEIRRLELQIAQEGATHSAKLDRLLQTYADKTEFFESINGYAYESEAIGILKGLGFSEEEMTKRVNSLSGGEMSRLMLGKLLLKKPDILLLDEPTNHLDTFAIEWLESYLKQYRGNILVISHDRYFLDHLVEKIFEIKRKKLNIYHGNYSYYIDRRDIQEELEWKAYKENQAELKRQKDIITQLRAFGREKQIKRAESRQKQLDKMEVLARPIEQDASARIRFQPQVLSGYDVLQAKGLKKSFGDRILFEDLSLSLYRGETVALIGANGVGKTSLFRILLGRDKEYDGKVQLGSGVHPIYFDQTRADLNESNDVLEELWSMFPQVKEAQIRSYLAAFLFFGDDVYKSVERLSGGEQSRLSLLKLMLSKANLLFLDEPTNHLDSDSKEALENAICAYEGTIFLISHDRYFLNRVADRILVLTPGGIAEYLGNYDYYQEKLQEERELLLMKEAREAAAVNKTQIKKMQRVEKEKQKDQRKKRRLVESLESEIEALEQQVTTLQENLCELATTQDHASYREMNETLIQIESKLEEAYQEWEEAHREE